MGDGPKAITKVKMRFSPKVWTVAVLEGHVWQHCTDEEQGNLIKVILTNEARLEVALKHLPADNKLIILPDVVAQRLGPDLVVQFAAL